MLCTDFDKLQRGLLIMLSQYLVLNLCQILLSLQLPLLNRIEGELASIWLRRWRLRLADTPYLGV